MKKISKLVALSLVLALLCGNTAFAAESSSELDISNELATEGYDVTKKAKSSLMDSINDYFVGGANAERIAVAAKDVLSGKKVTYTNAAQLSCLVQLGYSFNNGKGTISITKGVLTYKNWWWTEKENVYVVCMSGTDFGAKNSTTGVITDLLSGFEFDNKYVRNIKKAIMENVPANSNIILTGHSLGGMVAQQVAADRDIKAKYNIMNTVTFGSPLIKGLSREGMVRRLGDTSDVVPYLSVSTFTNIVWQAAGLNRENGGYGAKAITAHNQSYNRQDVWGAYDVCGQKRGSRKLELDLSTTRVYASPVIVTE